jgi:hypothetical protein
MKSAMKHCGRIVALLSLSALAVVLPSCIPTPTEHTIIVTVTGFPAANGHKVYVGVMDEAGSLIGINSATNGLYNTDSQSIFSNGSVATQHIFMLSNPSTELELSSDETYRLAVWVDMNDNMASVATPEKGVDYECHPFPRELSPTRDQINLGMTVSDFILVP